MRQGCVPGCVRVDSHDGREPYACMVPQTVEPVEKAFTMRSMHGGLHDAFPEPREQITGTLACQDCDTSGEASGEPYVSALVLRGHEHGRDTGHRVTIKVNGE